ncbi:hypothetical protein GIW32_13640 [Pseudomonas syringae]|nr:hypothetical protein [Pseudomonas syringae]MCF5241755.1 hypothetical protein [Pseudomonas syringae]
MSSSSPEYHRGIQELLSDSGRTQYRDCRRDQKILSKARSQIGDSFEEGQPYKPPPGWDAGFEFSWPRRSSGSAPDCSDFFADFFGQAHQEGRHGSRAQKGEDQHSSINVEVADLYSGTTQTIALRGPRHDASGRLVIQDHTLSVKIPKGIRPGQQIRLSGQGLPGSGGELAGDLHLEIQLRADPRYRVEGRGYGRFFEPKHAGWLAVFVKADRSHLFCEHELLLVSMRIGTLISVPDAVKSVTDTQS